MQAAPELFNSSCTPYVAKMIGLGIPAIRQLSSFPTSTASVPLSTLIGVYFWGQVMDKYRNVTSTAPREALCSAIDGNLALLPRMLDYKNVNAVEKSELTETGRAMRAWAQVCDPMSLGSIHAYVQSTQVYWHTQIVASDSVSLQVLLYLYEKQRLQAPKHATSSGNESLFEVLLKDRRVTPLLLQSGRPESVSKCIVALQTWCNLNTLDGETLEPADRRLNPRSGIYAPRKASSSGPRRSTGLLADCERAEYSVQRRRQPLLSQQIVENDYAVTKNMFNSHLQGWNNGPAKDDTLRDYLIWEMSPPSFLKLESALFRALKRAPKWQQVFRTVLRSFCRNDKWRNSVLSLVVGVLRSIPALQDTACVLVKDISQLEIAAIETALEVPGYQQSLKSAIIGVGRTLPGWRDSFGDWKDSSGKSIVEKAMPEWKELVEALDIKRLSETYGTQTMAVLNYMVPTVSGRQEKEEAKKEQKEVIQQLLDLFVKEAKPYLEEVYGQKPGKSTCSTAPIQGR
jgi:hypothetical protein